MAISFILANNQSTNTTEAFTVSSGSNRFLLLSITCRGGSITSVTYGVQGMTQLGTIGGHVNAGDTEYLFGLIAPASGSNNVAIVHTGTAVFWVVAEYNGVDQTTATESVTTNSGTGASTPSVTVTPTKSDWIVMGMWQNNGSPTADGNTTFRNAGTANNNVIGDSNSNKTSSFTIGTNNASTSFDVVGCGLIDATQPTATATKIPTLLLMGVG